MAAMACTRSGVVAMFRIAMAERWRTPARLLPKHRTAASNAAGRCNRRCAGLAAALLVAMLARAAAAASCTADKPLSKQLTRGSMPPAAMMVRAAALRAVAGQKLGQQRHAASRARVLSGAADKLDQCSAWMPPAAVVAVPRMAFPLEGMPDLPALAYHNRADAACCRCATLPPVRGGREGQQPAPAPGGQDRPGEQRLKRRAHDPGALHGHHPSAAVAARQELGEEGHCDGGAAQGKAHDGSQQQQPLRRQTGGGGRMLSSRSGRPASDTRARQQQQQQRVSQKRRVPALTQVRPLPARRRTAGSLGGGHSGRRRLPAWRRHRACRRRRPS